MLGQVVETGFGLKNRYEKPASPLLLKSGILDPQGKAIEGALRSLGLAGVSSVRQGKVFDIEIEGGDRAKAEALLKQAAGPAARRNTVIENYKVDVLG